MLSDTSRNIEKLVRDMDDIRDEFASMVRHMRDGGAERGHDALARADKVRARARETARYAEKRAGEEIGTHPFVSLLAAVGVGFLIAKLLDMDRGATR